MIYFGELFGAKKVCFCTLFIFKPIEGTQRLHTSASELSYLRKIFRRKKITMIFLENFLSMEIFSEWK
jgi:hypothetical protein